MIYTITSTATLETVKEELEAKAKEVGFGLLNTYEFKKILKEKGFPIEKDISVFELCNPAGAQQALEYDSAISVYLPCRISVYQEKGVTVLSTIGLDDIVTTFNVDERFASYMHMLFENLKQIMHSWDD